MSNDINLGGLGVKSVGGLGVKSLKSTPKSPRGDFGSCYHHNFQQHFSISSFYFNLSIVHNSKPPLVGWGLPPLWSR